MSARNMEAEMKVLWAWARNQCVLRELPAEMTFIDEDEDDNGMRLEKRVGLIDYTFTVDVILGAQRREVAKLFARFPEGSAEWEAEVPRSVSEAALAAGRQDDA